MNRQIYRRARESSVRGAYGRLEEILGAEGKTLTAIILLSLGAGLLGAWLISRGLSRPLQRLTQDMAVVGTGKLDHPIAVVSRDEVGELARSFASMTDRLNQSRAKVVQAEKLASIGEMSAAVAHGLRNPLASLRAAAQLVRKHPASPSAAEHLDAILGEVDRLDRRISHLLSFSRPAPFNPMPESLPRLVDDVLPAMRQPIQTQGVELQVDIPPDLPSVKVDPTQVEQAVLEIVTNALDAMPKGGRLRIAASTAVNGASPADVVLEVSDTGAGIPEAALASVFEPFFTTRQEGTGLGLAIAKRYVEQNGGRLEIESRPGRGTTVRLRLPSMAADA
jgi:signal transduction histidine kinase